MSFAPLKFGIFISAPDNELASKEPLSERNRSLIELLDELGYDHVWVNHRVTAGIEEAKLTEAALGSLAERTRNLKFGVCCPPALYQQPLVSALFPVSVSCQYTPEGARTAGTHGAEIITTDATTPGGFNALGPCWEVYERYASKNNQVVDRNNWSLVGPVHIASSHKQAFRNVNLGLKNWITFCNDHTGVPIVPEGEKNAAAYLVESGLAVIGTPNDATNQIKRLQTQSGGFGRFLQLAHSWADPKNTEKSYRLFAQKVMPKFSA